MSKTFLGCVVFCLVLGVAASGGYSQGKISGYMFGDYYYVAQNHDPTIEGRNGLWFRRIYFTYDHGLSDEFSVRFRLELSSAGNFINGVTLQPFMKDGYLKWSKSGHSIILGLSPTPTFEYIEEFWGYRAIEKTPADLYKFGSSRDLGIAFKGTLGAAKKVRYHFMLANGGGNNGADTNKGKKALLSLGYQLTSALYVEVYGDWEERPGDTNRYTWQGFLGFQKEKYRLGAQILQQTRQTPAADLKLEVASFFAAAQLREKLWGYVRFDHGFDPFLDGPTIDYLPFDNTAEANFVIAGVDFEPVKQVHIMPNIEYTFYQETAGLSPDADAIPRLTFYYIWK